MALPALPVMGVNNTQRELADQGFGPTLRHNQVICNQAHNQPHNQALQYAARSSTQRARCLRIYSVENGADAAEQRKSIAMG